MHIQQWWFHFQILPSAPANRPFPTKMGPLVPCQTSMSQADGVICIRAKPTQIQYDSQTDSSLTIRYVPPGSRSRSRSRARVSGTVSLSLDRHRIGT